MLQRSSRSLSTAEVDASVVVAGNSSGEETTSTTLRDDGSTGEQEETTTTTKTSNNNNKGKGSSDSSASVLFLSTADTYDNLTDGSSRRSFDSRYRRKPTKKKKDDTIVGEEEAETTTATTRNNNRSRQAALRRWRPWRREPWRWWPRRRLEKLFGGCGGCFFLRRQQRQHQEGDIRRDDDVFVEVDNDGRIVDEEEEVDVGVEPKQHVKIDGDEEVPDADVDDLSSATKDALVAAAAAMAIQSFWRHSVAKQNAARVRKETRDRLAATTTIQCCGRRYIAKQKAARIRKGIRDRLAATTTIQCCGRRYIAQQEAARIRAAATIQRFWRCTVAKREAGRIRAAATIQRFWRCTATKREADRIRAATTIQRFWNRIRKLTAIVDWFMRHVAGERQRIQEHLSLQDLPIWEREKLLNEKKELGRCMKLRNRFAALAKLLLVETHTYAIGITKKRNFGIFEKVVQKCIVHILSQSCSLEDASGFLSAISTLHSPVQERGWELVGLLSAVYPDEKQKVEGQPIRRSQRSADPNDPRTKWQTKHPANKLHYTLFQEYGLVGAVQSVQNSGMCAYYAVLCALRYLESRRHPGKIQKRDIGMADIVKFLSPEEVFCRLYNDEGHMPHRLLKRITNSGGQQHYLFVDENFDAADCFNYLKSEKFAGFALMYARRTDEIVELNKVSGFTLDGPADQTQTPYPHAMLLVGMHCTGKGKKSKWWFYVQNWWPGSQFIEMSEQFVRDIEAVFIFPVLEERIDDASE